MSGLALSIVILVVIIGLLVPGIVLINVGKNNVKQQIAGWCLIGGLITLMCVGLGVLVIQSAGAALLLLIFLSPVIIIAGLVLTLTFGINCLVKGFFKNKDGKFNKSNIITGFVLLGINAIILLAIIVLTILFANGLIPIALM